ncbi:MAG: NYN domain-containing protein, partial [Planctomycetota bacterium]
MELLIDGYNLLHATDLFGSGAAAGTLQGSREALLDFLARAMPESQRRRATIVFDAAEAPPGLPATMSYRGITVHFARDYPDADSMLEALIESRSSGKGLTVVSSDRRVQRAARGRGAKWLASDAWYGELRFRFGAATSGDAEPKPTDIGDPEYWADQFSDEATLAALEEEQRRQRAVA